MYGYTYLFSGIFTKGNFFHNFLFAVLADQALPKWKPGRVAQSVGHLTRKSGVLGWIPGLAT